MTWFKVDDGFWSHPKVLNLSDSAVALWTRAGAYCCQHLTDGFVSSKILRVLGEENAALELVDSGLWRELKTGFKFHDWDEYQETSEVVKTRRKQARERMQRVRAARKSSPERSQDVRANNTRTNPERSQEVQAKFATPDPTRPDPTNKEELPKGSSKKATANGHRLPCDWTPSEDVIEKMRNEHPHVDQNAELAKFHDYWAGVPGAKGRKLDWNATYRNWIRRASTSYPQHATSKPGNSIADWLGVSEPSEFVDAEIITLKELGT